VSGPNASKAERPGARRLLAPQDAAPFTVRRRPLGRHLGRPTLVVCDHASNAVPLALAALGLPAEARARHIAWDPGAGALAEALAERLRLTLVRSGFSRLVIDCNRPLQHAGSILAVSDGQGVPGNTGLSANEREQRVAEIFAPYHAAIELELLRLATSVAAPALIAVHSFTPKLNSTDRPWHCGVLWDRDPRIPVPLIAALRGEPGVLVGDNEPYSGKDPSNYTINTHAEARGWAHVCLEVRQDLLADAAGVALWSERLALALEPILDDASLYSPSLYSEREPA